MLPFLMRPICSLSLSLEILWPQLPKMVSARLFSSAPPIFTLDVTVTDHPAASAKPPLTDTFSFSAHLRSLTTALIATLIYCETSEPAIQLIAAVSTDE